MSARAALVFVSLALIASMSPAPAAPRYAIAIHGGAGSSPEQFSDAQNAERRAGIEAALKAGQAVLEGGGSALDAVETSVRALEDNPIFNAGRGAVLNAAGQAELDASIMDGRTKACGAVAAITVAKNPIVMARAVMTETRHVLLAADGADAFAREAGAELVDRDYFVTPGQRARWEEAKVKAAGGEGADATGGDGAPLRESDRIGTVGCVALDADGNLAAGTSTGGLLMKKFGRVGDSPIVGAGTYADNTTCAVSCTGVGEEFIRNAIAHDIHSRLKYRGEPLREAVAAQLREVLKPGQGGIIALGADGEIVMDFNTGGMACGAADSAGRFEVRWGSR